MRSDIDEIGARYGIPLHATGFGHLFGMHWAPERVVDYRTRMLDDNEKLANIMLGLLNEGVYQYSFGTLLLSAAHSDAEINEFLAALDCAPRAVELV
jgi:glutamate-1-semialdehyde aminotransferase